MEKAKVLVVDKTGTLTLGQPKLTQIITDKEFEIDEILALAAALEHQSEHPLAHAIITAAKEKQLSLTTATDFEAIAGKGIIGKVKGVKIAFGNLQLMKEYGTRNTPLIESADELRAKGATVMFMAVDGEMVAILAVEDPIKSSTPDAILELQENGI